MPGRFSVLGRSKSTKTRNPFGSSGSSSRGRKDIPVPSSSSKPGRPKTSQGATSGGFLKPSVPRPSSRRSRSHESTDRQSRPPLTSIGRSAYDRPVGSTGGRRLRSVSPKLRPLPTDGSFRAPRPRPRRDSSISGDEASRPISRRPSLSPPRLHNERLARPRQDTRRSSHSPPRAPLNRFSPQPSRRSNHPDPVGPGSGPVSSTRPPIHSYATDHYRPRPSAGSRNPSYNSIPQVLHEAAGGSRASTPPKYRPVIHDHAGRDPTNTKLRTRDEVHSQGTKQDTSLHGRGPRVDNAPSAHYVSHYDHDSSRGSRNSPKGAKPSYPEGLSKPHSQSPPKSPRNGAAQLFKKIPEALAAYGGLEALSEHADTAKGWADWLNQIRDAPEEMQGLSAKVQTARDTITQIQNTLEARPDLVEGDSGQRLRNQIEAAIESTNDVLSKMKKVLQDLSKTTANDGSIMSGVQEFYNSYKYRNEWEDKIKEADSELQKELSGLSTLMINLYSRALMKPAPPGANTAIPPPNPSMPEPVQKEEKGKVPPEPSEAPIPAPIPEPDPGVSPKAAGSSASTHSGGLEPPPVPQLPRDVHLGAGSPPSPAALSEEEATIGTGNPTSEPQPAGATPTEPEIKHSAPDPKLEPATEPRQDSKQSEAGSVPAIDAEEALLDAAWSGNLEATAAALRNAPASVCDQKGLTPLHLAAERDNLAIAMLLLDKHADANSRANGGRTPLHLASRFASAATVELLLEDGKADPNARTTDGRTPLHYATSSAEDGDEERREVVRVLRDWGADPTLEDSRGRTPREVAQKRDFWDVSSTLRRAEKRWEDEHPQGWFQKHGFRK